MSPNAKITAKVFVASQLFGCEEIVELEMHFRDCCAAAVQRFSHGEVAAKP